MGESDFWMLPAAVLLYYISLCYSHGLFPQKLCDNHCTWLFFHNLLPTPGCTMRQLKVHSY